jgi:hypothetical protein
MKNCGMAHGHNRPMAIITTLHFLCNRAPFTRVFVLAKLFQPSVMQRSNLLGKFIRYKKYAVLWKRNLGRIHNTSFSVKLINGPNKLKCLS